MTFLRISITLVFVIVIIVVNATDVKCPENEEYNECGSACQANCTHTEERCTLQCVPGCFCKKNFVREGDNKSKCIPRSQCPCPDNEFFDECGSACPDTCAERSQLCTKQCVPSCSCKSGFIRLNNQTNSPCIPESQCNNSLCHDPNAEYNECGSACPKTCDDERNPILKYRACPGVCRQGCFCKRGYVLGDDGQCVKPETCCKTINASYHTCGIACPRTCTHKNNLSCFLPCIPGCFCDKDYILRSHHMNSPCILETKCERLY